VPVRDKAVALVVADVHGVKSFRNLPEGWLVITETGEVPREVYDEWAREVDRHYVTVVDSIDWNRVLLEASARHIALSHEDKWDYGMVCPECVCEALLANGTHVDWKRQPRAPRERA
jgi:hypothetical protein